MWINELLYVLMFAALIAVIVLAVVVNTRLSRSKQLEQMETTEEIKPEPVADLVREQEPEPELELEVETKTEPKNLQDAMIESEPLPEYEQEPLVDKELESKLPTEPEDKSDVMSYYVRENERQVEDQYFGLRNDSKVEETVDLEMPFYFELPQETKDEQTGEAEIKESWYVPEEPMEKNEKEAEEGVLVCPHCNSQVPNTIYCIYCGNSLKSNPFVEDP